MGYLTKIDRQKQTHKNKELIETLVWAHERTPLANLVRWRYKPVALSIVQARLVGLVHFAVGYILTYASFVIASTSGKFG